TISPEINDARSGTETKKARQPKLPRIQANFTSKLELKLRSDLYLPGRINEVAVGVGDRTEQWIEGFINVEIEARSRCAAGHIPSRGGHVTGCDGIRGRIHARHILLIGNIEEIAKQLNAVLFGHLEALGQPYVANPVVGLAESV